MNREWTGALRDPQPRQLASQPVPYPHDTPLLSSSFTRNLVPRQRDGDKPNQELTEPFTSSSHAGANQYDLTKPPLNPHWNHLGRPLIACSWDWAIAGHTEGQGRLPAPPEP